MPIGITFNKKPADNPVDTSNIATSVIAIHMITIRPIWGCPIVAGFVSCVWETVAASVAVVEEMTGGDAGVGILAIGAMGTFVGAGVT